jgi:hypothetical protein
MPDQPTFTSAGVDLDKLTRYMPKSAYGGPAMTEDKQGDWLSFAEVEAHLARHAAPEALADPVREAVKPWDSLPDAKMPAATTTASASELQEQLASARFEAEHWRKRFIEAGGTDATSRPQTTQPTLIAVATQPSETPGGLIITVHLKQGEHTTVLYGGVHPTDCAAMATHTLEALTFRLKRRPAARP